MSGTSSLYPVESGQWNTQNTAPFQPQRQEVAARVASCARVPLIPFFIAENIHPIFSIAETGSIITAYLGPVRIGGLSRIFHYDSGLESIISLENKMSLNPMEIQSYQRHFIRLGMPATVGDVIKFCPHLRSLDLSYSSIADADLENLAKHLSTLTTLNLQGCDQLTDRSLQLLSFMCPNLTDLNLSECPLFTDRGVEALFQGSRCKKLTHINLACCNISDNALQILANECPNLIFLSCEKCSLLSDNGVQALSGCPGLNFLNLSGCHLITDEGLTTLSNWCNRLTQLDLGGCHFLTDEGVTALSENCARLTELHLTECTHISDISLLSLSEGCRELTLLNLSGCVLITDEGVGAISRRCKQLSHLLLARCDLLTSVYRIPR